MICVPGHGRGVDDIVGIDEQGRDRTDKSGYQHDFAIQVAETGMAAVAIEPLGFGCRRDPINARRGLGAEGVRADRGRGADGRGRRCSAGASGTSCGRSTTSRRARSWTRRASAAWGSRAAARRRCSERRSNRAFKRGDGQRLPQHVSRQHRQPGALRRQLRAGDPELGGDARRRRADCAEAVVCRVGERDNIFPIDASVESFRQAQEIYKVFQATDRVEQEVFPGEHSFWGRRASRSSRAICGRSGGPRRSNAELAEHAEIVFSFWTDVAPLKGRPTPRQP